MNSTEITLVHQFNPHRTRDHRYMVRVPGSNEEVLDLQPRGRTHDVMGYGATLMVATRRAFARRSALRCGEK